MKYIFGYSQYIIPATKTAKAKTVSFPRHDPIHEQLRDLLGHTWRPYFHWREFLMGGAFIVILVAMKHIGRRWPRCDSAFVDIVCLRGLFVLLGFIVICSGHGRRWLLSLNFDTLADIY